MLDKFRNRGWHFSLLLAALVLGGLSAQGQTVETNISRSTSDQTQIVNIEHYLDRLIAGATVAADAASVIKEADHFRADANQRLRSGRRNEARALLRHAAEVIAAAAPDGDGSKQFEAPWASYLGVRLTRL